MMRDNGTSSGDLTTPGAYTPFGGVSRGFSENASAGPLSYFAVPPRVAWYAATLALLAASLVAVLASSGVGRTAPFWAIIGLVAVALLAERQSVRVGLNTQTSVAALPILFAAVVFGPFEAMLVAGVSVAVDFRRPYTRWLTWTFARTFAAGTAATVVLVMPDVGSSFGKVVVAVAAAAITEGLLDAFLNSLTVMLRRSGSFRGTLIDLSRLLLSTAPLYTPVVAALAYAYKELSPWTVVLFFVPALAAQRLLMLYQEQRDLAGDLRAANRRLEHASLSFAGALVAALDARDRYTAGHSAAVAVYARDIAAALGLSDADCRLAHLCGLLHDVGKVGLPAGILEKDGPLSVSERTTMEEHAVIGERILANVDDYRDVATIVRHHHERFDGNGYPDGLAGRAIPLIARIIAVADAYNAMTSGRPYRAAMTSEIARSRLAESAGTQFDADVVAAFETLLTAASDNYVAGESADFAIEAQRHDQAVGLATVATPA